MGKKLKRNKAGNAAQYMTRNQAIKKLQLKLADFRRLCILKGIHPREPKKKVQGANKTYYHTKDINFLMHEPLVHKFRSLKSYERKARRAQAKKNPEAVKRILANRPTYTLDHLVKERYPSFIDALRDMDDALTLLSLFATLPPEAKHEIPVKVVHTSQRLVMEFQAYIVRAAALRKVFISVKGYYFQAEIMGQAVTWLIPHQLAPILPVDVDYRVMLTFLEFYITFLQFVNFKLYHSLGLRYPPVLDSKLEEAASGLAALMHELAEPEAAASEDAGASANQQGAPVEVDQSMSQRINTLQEKLQELVQQGDGTASAPTARIAQPRSSTQKRTAAAAGSEDSEGGEQQEDTEGEGGQDEGEQGSPGAAMDADDDTAADTQAQGGTDPLSSDTLSLSDDAQACANLFKGLVFFLAREVPREPLLFVIRAFGGVAAWDGAGSPYPSNDDAITHHVVDRPTQGHVFLSRAYVQPQWVVDSANNRILMPTDLYVPGKPPPPHLSPFSNADDDYVPDFARVVESLKQAAQQARLQLQGTPMDAEQAEQAAASAAVTAATQEGEAAEQAYFAELERELGGQAGEEQAATQEGEEAPATAAASKSLKRSSEVVKAAEDEEALMKDITMTSKNRKLYQRIMRAKEGRRERTAVLEERKKKLAKKASR